MNALLRLDFARAVFLLTGFLIAFLAMAQAPGAGPGEPSATSQAAPVAGEFRPSPQPNPTRLIVLVPVVDVPGTNGAKAPLFLEDRESPQTLAGGRLKTDASKAEVPGGIVSFRAMYSTDGQWALVDLHAREASALEPVRASRDVRLRIFTPGELANPTAASRVQLPEGLNLAKFLEP
ncbi:MAG: hypothetical protein IT170_03960 [Bryobacterales bacterium]|nr:hypothetical protein [Bryobacterales bacterium]